MRKRTSILCITPIEHIPNIKEFLSSLGELDILPDPDPSDVRRVVGNYDAIFTNPNKSKVYLGEDVLGCAEKLKVICTASTGTNHIDKEWTQSQGIKTLSLTTEYHVIEKISSTAEMAFGLMMCGLRNIIPANKSIGAGIWDYIPFVGRQLNMLKVGVIGYGRLGKLFSGYCKAFGADVYIYDPYEEICNEYIRIVDLYEALPDLDVISFHVHLNDETKNMVDDRWFFEMKEDVLLVNTSRGEIINENQLISFLRKNHSAKICTDVLAGEIHGFQYSELYKCSRDNNQVIITPHIGGMTLDAQKMAYSHAANMLEKFLNSY
jgi:D-3-phosphoglycerate dehydrogenase